MQQTTVQADAPANPVPPMTADEIAKVFSGHFGRENPRLFFAPGRVNLIGDHTDYNEGFVLPVAIDMGTVAAGLTREDRLVRVFSVNENEEIAFDLDSETPHEKGHWINYVEGVARSLEAQGHRLKGLDLLLSSNVPVGSGLSSSAALENSVGYAMLSLSQPDKLIDKVQLALAGQAAEHHYVGTQCGIMDQLITALARRHHALLIDCRTLETQSVPMNLPDLAVVICDSQVKHSLASSAYNQRVEECRRGVEFLQQVLPAIKTLRDVSVEDFERHQAVIADGIVRKRVRHVVTENARTKEAAEALLQGDKARVGKLMLASHESLKNDYEVSCPEIDTLVEIAKGLPGLIGTRMTGGGFGGCTVSLVERSQLDAFARALTAKYKEALGLDARIYIIEAGSGVTEMRAGAQTSQEQLNARLEIAFDEAFEHAALADFIRFANEQMPVFEPGKQLPVASHLAERAELRQGDLTLAVTPEFGIRLYWQGKQLTTDVENVPMDYPWFKPDPDDPEDIPSFATRHVGRGSRGESPWPENLWPQVGGVRQGEQNWPHRDVAFGPYRLQILEADGRAAIALSQPENSPNAYGVIPRGLFTLGDDGSVILALQHENHSDLGIHWHPWFVLGFAMPPEGTLTNPSTILAFPDDEAPDSLQDRVTKVWNYMDIAGQKMALINPHAKTLNETFKKIYRDVNWSVIAGKGQDFVILTRSILRHEEQFFPFLEHGRHFIEVEHTGRAAAPGEKSTLIVKHDLVPVSLLSDGKIQSLSRENGRFEDEVKMLLAALVARQNRHELVSNY